MEVNPNMPGSKDLNVLTNLERPDTRRTTSPDPEVATRVLQHPMRHVLLTLMDDDYQHTLAELTFAVGWPRSTVARHLKALAAAGLVTERTEKQRGAPDQEFYVKVTPRTDQRAENQPPPPGRTRYSSAVGAARNLDIEVTMSPEQAVEFWARVEDLALSCSSTESTQLMNVRVIAHVSAQQPQATPGCAQDSRGHGPEGSLAST